MAEDDSAYLTAMTTEHVALQSSAASTIDEANSRVSIHLSSALTVVHQQRRFAAADARPVADDAGQAQQA